MGQQSLEGMLEVSSFERALSWHLTSNHFPPVPVTMVQPCIEAIDAFNEGESDRLIDLGGVSLWRGQTAAPAWAIIEGHHLESFLADDDEMED